ncbi:MAG: VWA domain-containing protein [Synergistaceae bacterium]|nr:VWA domain-containing protein [Synergistaceae bacterium]
MKTDLTELVFILDRSGSMSGLESDTIGGFNSMIDKQRTESGDCRLTTVLFDHEYEVLHDRIDIKAVSPITREEYFVRGSTALLDAVGRTIHKIDSVQKRTAEEYRARKVLFIITTDGMENASSEYSYEKVKSMVEQRREKCGWEFIFLGADIDAVETGERLGIDRARARKFRKDGEGIHRNYYALDKVVHEFRGGARISKDWGVEIEEYEKESDAEELANLLSKQQKITT